MRCCCEVTPEEQISIDIDKDIKTWIKPYHGSIRLLLLGTGESGKTTIIKQMKILHIKGFSESDRLEKIIDIRSNVHESIYDLSRHVQVLDLEFDNQESTEIANYIINLGPTLSEFSSEYFHNVDKLWQDSGIQKCYKRSNEFQLIDSAKFFLDKLDTISSVSYIPSDQDILQCRKKTTGIQKVEFNINVSSSLGGGKQSFWMFDVGGQRSERKKWIHVFEGINSVLFLVASSDFDLTLREDPTYNRLKESINLFEDVWKSRFLTGAGFIVFLNKQDTLEQKIREGHKIINYFPEYEFFQASEKDGNPFEDYIRTRCFIRNKFREITYSPSPTNRECYFHFTIATNTENIRRVIADVHNMILERNVRDIDYK